MDLDPDQVLIRFSEMSSALNDVIEIIEVGEVRSLVEHLLRPYEEAAKFHRMMHPPEAPEGLFYDG